MIQRRKSDCAPISPRDEAEILRGKVEKQENLAAELREKDSELEDLGCWRALLAKVKLNRSHKYYYTSTGYYFQRDKPIRQLTEVRKKAWSKTKKKFFASVIPRE